MLEFISENLSTIIIGVLVLIVLFFAARKLIKDKKSGKGTCGGNCSKCMYGCKNSKN